MGLPSYVRLVAGASLLGEHQLRDIESSETDMSPAARSLIEDSTDLAICWDGGR